MASDFELSPHARPGRWCSCRLLHLLLASFLIVGTGRTAQATQPLTGLVLDAETRLSIPHAIVEVRETGDMVQAGADGRFDFGIMPSGVYHVCVRRIGYRETCDVSIRLGSEEPSPLTVELVPEPLRGDAVWVRAGPDHDIAAASIREVITEEQIRRSGAANAADILVLAPDVEVLRAGSQRAGVSIRGSRPEAVAVLVDEVPLNSDGGAVDLTTIPAASIERIEIVKGPAVAVAGPDALAGAVLITTRAVGGRLQATAAGAYGSWAQREARLQVDGLALGAQRLSGAWQAVRGDGDFRYYDNQFERDTVRANNVYRNEDLMFRGRGAIAGPWNWQASYNRHEVNAGVSGPEFALTPEAARRQRRDFITTSIERRSSAVNVRLNYAFTGDENYFVNTGVLPYETESTVQQHRARAGISAGQGPLEGLRVAVDYTHEYLHGSDLRIPAYSFGTATRDNYALTGVFYREIAPGGGVVRTGRFSAAYRYDQTETHAEYPQTPISPLVEPPQSVWRFGSPHLVAGIRGVAAGFDWNVTSTYAKAFRRPPLLDQFMEESYRVRGNPGLRPERSEQIEVGYGLSAGNSVRVGFEQRFFRSRFDDLIFWRIGQGGVWAPDNIGRAAIDGREETVRLDVRDGLVQLRASHLFQDHRNTAGEPNTHGEPLPFQYRHKVATSLAITWRGFSGDVAWRWYDRRYLREAGRASKSEDPYGVVDIALALRFRLLRVPAQFSTRIDNVTDTDYELFEREPMPGRSFYISLTLQSPPIG